MRVIDVRSLVRVGTREKIPKTGKGSKKETNLREPRGGMRGGAAGSGPDVLIACGRSLL